jgi:hypothetical protein
MTFNAYCPDLLGFGRMRWGLFLQVEGGIGIRRAMPKGEDDLSGGYWFESSRRSKTPGQRLRSLIHPIVVPWLSNPHRLAAEPMTG